MYNEPMRVEKSLIGPRVVFCLGIATAAMALLLGYYYFAPSEFRLLTFVFLGIASLCSFWLWFMTRNTPIDVAIAKRWKSALIVAKVLETCLFTVAVFFWASHSSNYIPSVIALVLIVQILEERTNGRAW